MTRYRNPPVNEVVAEFFFQPANWDLAVPGLVFEKLKDEFPVRRMPNNPPLIFPAPPAMTILGQQVLVPNPIPRTDRVFFIRKDEKVLVQVAPNLMVVNNVKMWTEWEDFFPVIKSVFEKYTSVVENWKIARLGLQYINHLKFPTVEGKVDLEDYLEFYPHTGKNLPDHGPFAMSVQFPTDPKEPLKDWVEVQLSAMGFTPDFFNTKLEIKSYTPTSRELDLNGIYNWMEQAHHDVVRVFEGCLTEKSRELFRREPDA